MENLSGKVAVITGGASGIGRAMASRFAADGMHVVIADIEQGPLDATAAELGVLGIRTDVSSAESVAALATTVIERFGAVHVLCNNAGVGGGGEIAGLSLDDWRWVIDVNLWGVVHGLHYFMEHLLANTDGGHIVNTASMAGLTAWPGIGPYNATKYAVVGISETLALELQGTAVGVSVLCPGLVNTNIFTSQRNKPAELRSNTPNLQARAANEGLLRELGIDPSTVADLVAHAVRNDQFWILTHREMLPALHARHERLTAAEAGAVDGGRG